MTQSRRQSIKRVGGHAALDFINTVHDWTVSDSRDYLRDFADAIQFGEMTGLLTRKDAAHLRRQRSHVELTRLRELRALLKRIFQKRLCHEVPSRPELGKLNADLVEAARATQLIAATQNRRFLQGSMKREIVVEKAGNALLRLRIVEAAVGLLESDAMARVKSCPACGWLFLDVSKNQSRRWCSMDTCGAVAKARRYYRRLKDRARR